MRSMKRKYHPLTDVPPPEFPSGNVAPTQKGAFKMHYRVRGFVVRSENAAKPHSQASAAVVSWIKEQPRVHHALDYGCGKLRYSGALASRAHRLTLVDSLVQIDRVQSLCGTLGSVREYAATHWLRSRVLSAAEFWRRVAPEFDLVLCANVLSAIPSRRMRSRALMAIHASLTTGGKCLFVNQYRNSEFKATVERATATPLHYGWLLQGHRGVSYYGLWPVDRTVRALRARGYRIHEAWRRAESSFVLAGR